MLDDCPTGCPLSRLPVDFAVFFRICRGLFANMLPILRRIDVCLLFAPSRASDSGSDSDEDSASATASDQDADPGASSTARLKLLTSCWGFSAIAIGGCRNINKNKRKRTKERAALGCALRGPPSSPPRQFFRVIFQILFNFQTRA